MTRPKTRHISMLRNALTANAVFSSLSALIFLAASARVADLVGAPRADIVSTGIGLIVFVAMILLVLTRPDVTRRWVFRLAVVIAALDVLWVVTTPLKVASFLPVGKWIFGGIALVVAIFATLQIRALYGSYAEMRQAEPADCAVSNPR